MRHGLSTWELPRSIAQTGVEPLVAALDRAGYRLTEPRRAVAELIVAREGHFSAADLIDDARARRLGIGRATIFRALDLFTELSVLERLDLPTGEHAYVPCEPAGHHHHIVCSGCGRVTEIDEVGLALRGRPAAHRLAGRVPPPRALRPLPALPVRPPLVSRPAPWRIMPMTVATSQAETRYRHGRSQARRAGRPWPASPCSWCRPDRPPPRPRRPTMAWTSWSPPRSWGPSCGTSSATGRA